MSQKSAEQNQISKKDGTNEGTVLFAQMNRRSGSRLVALAAGGRTLAGSAIFGVILTDHTVLAVRKSVFRQTFKVVVLTGPTANIAQERNKTAAIFREGIFHARRNFRKLVPLDQTVADEFLQSIGKDSIRYAVERLFDVVITNAVFGIEQAQNTGLPAAAEEFERELQRATQILGEFRLIHDENTKSKKLKKV